MARRPTIADVAENASVSVATVDRVLNGRHKVREETARRVLEAAHKIGYHAAGLIEQRMKADLPEVRMGFVLQKERQAFYKTFVSEIEEAVRSAHGIRGTARILFSPSASPTDFIDQMRSLIGKVDAIAATAVTHHALTEAVSEFKAAGVPTLALLNDFAQGVREQYVGLNNLKVGRIAGYMIATSARKPGKLAVFVGGHRWHGHELRETGFRSYFREHAPNFEVIDTLVNLETRQLTYEATLDLLSRHPDLRGIYVAGGGMEGAIAALREARPPGHVTLVVNELTPESRAGLSDRYVAMVIGTPLRTVCREAVSLMVEAVDQGATRTPGQAFLEPVLYLPESV